jgi:D-sedoheptulose 7-phosphate isomerase
MSYAKDRGAFVAAITGPAGGAASRLADTCIRIPIQRQEFRTTHSEIFQAVVWHLLVTHPLLNSVTPKWESLD